MSEHPPHVYASEVDDSDVRRCRGCGARIVWGKTNLGRNAPFDYPRSSDGWLNHWISCKNPPQRKRVTA